MTSRPARPRTLLDFINRPILKGVAPAGNLKPVFTGKSGQNRKKIFGRVMYVSETIQNCKNPTGHIDTLNLQAKCLLTTKLHNTGNPSLQRQTTNNQLSLKWGCSENSRKGKNDVTPSKLKLKPNTVLNK